MSEDVRLDILKDAIADSGLDGQTKDALADDLRYVQEINGTNDPALRGIKRLVISGIRRELLAHDRTARAIKEHADACTGAGVPKTIRDAAMRAFSQYPVVLLIVVVLAVKEYGVTWLLKYFGVG